MKTLFIKAAAQQDVRLTRRQIDSLHKPVGIVTTAQHEHSLKDVQRQINGSVICGTVLGCDVSNATNMKRKVRSYLFVGTGTFHPLMIALKTGRPVYVFNVYDSRISRIQEKDIQRMMNRQKAAFLKFLHASTVGILVSTKPGQQNLEKAISLRNQLKQKQCYIFLADTIDTNSLRDFTFVDCFVNTACPRLSESSEVPMVNLEEVIEHHRPACSQA